MDNIRFLVIWMGSICTLRCKNCSNLIPYIDDEIYDVEKIIANIRYITKSIHIENMQIQGGEPFVYKGLSRVLREIANDNNIGHITIASNATVQPDIESIDILKNNYEKMDVRFSVYECVDENKRNAMILDLKSKGVNVNTYNFLYGNGKWFDSGDVYNSYTDDKQRVFEIYKRCGNHNCWTIVDDLLVNCSKIISLLRIKGIIDYEGNNIVNISRARLNGDNISSIMDSFNYTYLREAPVMCGYCKESKPELKPAIQLTNSELEYYKKHFDR